MENKYEKEIEEWLTQVEEWAYNNPDKMPCECPHYADIGWGIELKETNTMRYKAIHRGLKREKKHLENHRKHSIAFGEHVHKKYGWTGGME